MIYILNKQIPDYLPVQSIWEFIPLNFRSLLFGSEIRFYSYIRGQGKGGGGERAVGVGTISTVKTISF